MASRAVIDYEVKTHGVFFRNPIGRMHFELYDWLADAARTGQESARDVLQPGHGYLTGELFDSIQIRPIQASRRTTFTGRYKVIAGAAPHNRVRYYQGKIERKFHYMAEGGKATRAWLAAHRANLESRIEKVIV